jgi:hypothetical protein
MNLSVLETLKNLPGVAQTLFSGDGAKKASFAFSHLEDGLPQGALIEVSGAPGGGKTEVVLQILAQNPGVRVAWIEEELTVYPCRFPQSQVDLGRVLFVEGETAAENLWAVHQTVRSQLFGIVVAHFSTPLQEMELRRLQLAAERAQASVILLSETPAKRGTWPLSIQLSVTRNLSTQVGRGILNVDVLKYRGQKAWQVRIG